MTLSQISLESFENDESGAPIQSAEYRRGFEAGISAAKASSEAQRSDAILAISGSLSDMSFGFAEARNYLFDGLRPLLAKVAEGVLPSVLHETFGAHLIEVIMQNFDAQSARPIEIAVPADVIADLSELTASQLSCTFQFVPDPNLTAGQAVLRQAETHIMIDLAALSDTLQSALRGLESLERTTSHG